MLTIKKKLEISIPYPLERIGLPSELFFFDIETTGFSGDHARLYLIGGIWLEADGWHLIQWFADTADSESSLLHSFFSFISAKGFRVLVHFNGDGFDLPFMLKRCSHLGLPYGFAQYKSFDIYKKIRPFRNILGLGSLKQKSIEHFLGISREDKYQGGDLIEIYHSYLKTRSQELLHLLTLHNEDDLKGMPGILPILNYPDFFAGPFCYLGEEIIRKGELTKEITDCGILSGIEPSGPALLLNCENSEVCLPVPLRIEDPPVSCYARGNRLSLAIGLYVGTLKHFYENYKDYYYLVYEDAAIHKSIGQYVAKEARVRAIAKNCYTKQEGCFLPQFSPILEPVMRQDLKDKITYVPLEQACLKKPERFRPYLGQLLSHLKLLPGQIP